jgi:hypothetical protein
MRRTTLLALPFLACGTATPPPPVLTIDCPHRYEVEVYDAAIFEPPPPRAVRRSEPPASPALEPEVVPRYVQSARNRLRACYQSSLATDPTLEGEVVIAVELDQNAQCVDVSVVRSPMPSSFTACVARALCAQQVARAGPTTSITVPVRFKAR